jgi:hypothetical protein
MKPLSFLIPAFALFVSCHGPAGSSSIALTKTSLYYIDTVRLALGSGDEKAAAKRLQEANDAYKHGGDTARIIDLYKASILLKPTAKAYYDLAGALLGARQYKEATDALYIAEHLGYTPLGNVMFRYAYAYANTSDENTAIHYMELAIQMGYAHPQQFLQRKFFPISNAHAEFEARYNEAISGGAGGNPDKSLWETYTAQYPPVDLPLTTNKQWMIEHRSDHDIGGQYEKFIPEMQNNKFARGDGREYFYIALVKKDNAFIAVLYGSAAEEGYEENIGNTLCLTLISYTPQGKIIDKMDVAGRTQLSDNYKVFTLQPNLQFEVREFEYVYDKDPADAGYDSSNIKAQNPLPPVAYRIAPNGKFERTTPPLALR